MAAKQQILIKPIITEKSERLSEGLSQYSFVVNRRANKIEIKNAIADMYNVQVKSVNTMVMPGKTKSRNTRGGLSRGITASYKKAIITLEEGEEIDFFGEL
ncbi:MAG: 50S ribosomal protein L23 [Saprospiraceae bacterium]